MNMESLLFLLFCMELVKFCMESLVWFLGMDCYGFFMDSRVLDLVP